MMFVLVGTLACKETGAEDPCDEGIFYDADGIGFKDFTEALGSAVLLDGVVNVCPGTHEYAYGFMPLSEGEYGWRDLVVRGAGRSETTVVSSDDTLGIGMGYAAGGMGDERWGTVLTVESMTLGPSAGDPYDIECYGGDGSVRDGCTAQDAFFNGEPQPSVAPSASVYFRDVAFKDGVGAVEAAAALNSGRYGIYSTITLEDCEVANNHSSASEFGGAFVFVDAEEPNPATLTSVNTDWGEGETDNSPSDVAFEVWADGATEPDTSNHYSWDGVADFVCSAETQRCE